MNRTPPTVNTSQGGCASRVQNILETLRERTQPDHAAIETSLGVLVSDLVTETVYRQILRALYGYYLPLETRLAKVLFTLPAEQCWRWAERSSLLADDLRALGTCDLEGIPLCTALPSLETFPSLVGCLYVLEGAALGGRVINRHLLARLGITQERGGRFVHGAGDETGDHWKRFTAKVSALTLTPDESDQTVTNAIATFRTMHAWCERARA